MTYTEVVDVKAQDYVRTAYSKGLGRGKVLLRHIIRNSFIPVPSTAGNLFSNLLIGTMVVEYVFRVPGLGGYFINSILNLDYPIIVGGVCFYTLVIASVNLLVDLLYPAVDPRITYTKSQK
jgi:ABC-type dipeptide/oligopeptide/nickel transport system permease component